jgi:hypothetical protein
MPEIRDAQPPPAYKVFQLLHDSKMESSVRRLYHPSLVVSVSVGPTPSTTVTTVSTTLTTTDPVAVGVVLAIRSLSLMAL